MKRITLYLSRIAVLVGVALTVLNLWSVWYEPDRHPKTINSHQDKAGIFLRDPDAVIEDLDAIDEIETEEDVALVTEAISSGILHYWPYPGNLDDDVLYSWQENWVLAGLGWAQLLWFDEDILPGVNFAMFERFDYEDAIYKGVGLCSQVSAAASDYFLEHDTPSYAVGLGGHVVSVVGPLKDNNTYIVDADYGVYLPYGIEEIEDDPFLIRSYYERAGYSSKQIDNLVEIYGPNGNSPYNMYKWGIVFTVVKWILPICVAAFGIFGIFWARRV